MTEDNIKKELNDVAESYGRKLAVLLAAAPLDDETKDNFAALIPEMSLEQLDKLTEVLEDKIAAAGLEKKLTKVKDTRDQAQVNLAEQTSAKLDDIENQIE